MSEILKDLRLNSVDGLCKVIEYVLKNPQEKPDGLMRDAFIAVCDQIEQYGGYESGIANAIAKVRAALDLPKPVKRKEQPDATETNSTEA